MQTVQVSYADLPALHTALMRNYYLLELSYICSAENEESIVLTPCLNVHSLTDTLELLLPDADSEG